MPVRPSEPLERCRLQGDAAFLEEERQLTRLWAGEGGHALSEKPEDDTL